jgi:alginate O-acetyltransferase complex protein AlgI
LLTFHIVLVGWIFFRSDSIGHAFTYIARIFQSINSSTGFFERVNWPELLMLFSSYWLMEKIELYDPYKSVPKETRNPWSLRSLRMQLILLAAIIYIGVFEGDVFIYFQF